MENCISTVPIHLKNDTDRQRSSGVQQHRHQQDRQYAENAQLPLRLVRRDKKAGQAPGV